jgi:cell division protein FtsB
MADAGILVEGVEQLAIADLNEENAKLKEENAKLKEEIAELKKPKESDEDYDCSC